MNGLPGLRPVDVVVQTHWDREWYLPHQSTAARLVEVMARVLPMLEDGTLHSFLFDGQTAAYEDLLAHAEPALAARARALAAQGRLLLGPWYVMADEFLVSGESLLRNLELGRADVEAATGSAAACATTAGPVGYLPDTFGHVAQMPMLLRQFGIHCAALWRGADAEHSTFDWSSPDGSTVGTVFLTEGYYQHPLNLPGEAGQAALKAYLDRIAPRALSPQLLLTQGGDHLLPAAELPKRIAAFNAMQSVYRLRQTTLATHVAAALQASAGKRRTLHGELRHNAQAFVLPDVLSTRRHLKRLHQQAEDRLLGEIEPLLAQCMPVDAWPARYLDACWRLLIQQQAHDSLCGCSIDAVHREMATRFQQLAQRLDALRDRAAAASGLQALLQHGQSQHGQSSDAGRAAVFADDSRLTLFNPLPQAFDGWQVVDVLLRAESVDEITVHGTTPSGEPGLPLPAVLLSATPDAIFRSPLDDFPDRLPALRCEIAVQVAVPGLAALALHIGSNAGPPRGAPPVTRLVASAPTKDARIENLHWVVALDGDGAISIQHKPSGRVERGVLTVQHELDAGDSYNHSPPHGADASQRLLATRWQLLGVRAEGPVRELLLTLAMTVPAGLDDSRRGGSAETVLNEGRLRLRLLGDETGIEAQLLWHNRALDQRTRLLWPCGDLAALHHTHADSAFVWLRRPLTLADVPDLPTRAEAPVAVNPSLSALTAGPWWLAHRAMQEFEIQRAGNQAMLAVTLVRSVGWLSRRDLRTRGVGAGPDLATPDAQCLGTEVFDFCFGLWPSTEDGIENGAEQTRRALALHHARRLRRPLLALRGHGQASTWREGVDIANSAVQVSAVRRLPALPGAPLELRLWNPTDTPQTLSLAVADWQSVRADGTPLPGDSSANSARGQGWQDRQEPQEQHQPQEPQEPQDQQPRPSWPSWQLAPHGLITLRRRVANPA